MSLLKQKRLTVKDITLLFKQGSTMQSSHLTLRYKTTRNTGCVGVVIVSSRAVQGAVQRNRLRRRVSPILRRYLIQGKPGCICALVVKRPELPLKSALEHEVLTLLEKSGILNR